MKPNVINKIELGYALTVNGIVMQQPCLADRYRTVTREWFLGVYGPALARALGEFGLSRNTAGDGWNCKDLCLFGVAYARMLNAMDGGPSESVAVGLIGYGGLGEPGHAVLAAVHDQNAVTFYDPTWQKEVQPTVAEKSLCRVTLF